MFTVRKISKGDYRVVSKDTGEDLMSVFSDISGDWNVRLMRDKSKTMPSFLRKSEAVSFAKNFLSNL